MPNVTIKQHVILNSQTKYYSRIMNKWSFCLPFFHLNRFERGAIRRRRYIYDIIYLPIYQCQCQQPPAPALLFYMSIYESSRFNVCGREQCCFGKVQPFGWTIQRCCRCYVIHGFICWKMRNCNGKTIYLTMMLYIVLLMFLQRS